MAKHKRRRSLPTPDPGASAPHDPGAPPPHDPGPGAEGRGAAGGARGAPGPGGAGRPPEAETAEYKRKLDRLFWLRICLAVGAGVAATFIFEPVEGEERRWASIAFMVVLFMATIVIGKSMNMQLPSSDRKKLVTQGIGSYVFLYLFMWIVTYTLVNMQWGGGGAGLGGPVSPIP